MNQMTKGLKDQSTKLKQAYDAEHFRQSGHELIDLLADYLTKATNGEKMPVLPWLAYEDAQQNWEEHYNANTPEDLFQKTLRESIHVHHPNYMGHQISPAAPMAALAGLLSDFLNNGMGVYEMGIVGSTLDRLVIKEVAKQMGFSAAADGVMTSGGTLANVTAMLTARSIRASEEVWTVGTQKKYALMVSEQAHYCVDRAARIMGWGSDGIIKIPSDERFRMRTEMLEEYLAKAKNRNVEVLAVVGSACSTSTGAYDDLGAIADFCEKHDLWFHIDGAHGAAATFSAKYKYLVKGIERADSVIMDFHKMLLTPSITTALIFKEGTLNFRTFAQEAKYLFEEIDDLDWYNMAKRTFECTKTMMSLKVYSLMQTYGNDLFDEYVTQVIDNTHLLHSILEEDPEFDIAAPPQANIICFRHHPNEVPTHELSQHNLAIRDIMKKDGTFYIVKTDLRGESYLRCTLTNPFTERKHLQEMVEMIKATARQLRTVASS